MAFDVARSALRSGSPDVNLTCLERIIWEKCLDRKMKGMEVAEKV